MSYVHLTNGLDQNARTSNVVRPTEHKHFDQDGLIWPQRKPSCSASSLNSCTLSWEESPECPSCLQSQVAHNSHSSTAQVWRKISETLMRGTQQNVLFLCSNQPFMSASRVKWTSHSPHAIFWALQLLGSLQILHIANLDILRHPSWLAKDCDVLQHSSTCPPFTLGKFRSSRGTFAAPATEKGHKYLTKRMATHRSQLERMTISQHQDCKDLIRTTVFLHHVPIAHVCRNHPKPWSTKGCSSQLCQGTGSRTPITFRWPFSLA